MAQNSLEELASVPTMLEVCTTFGKTLDGAVDICQTPAEVRYLVGNALLILADNLEKAFPSAGQEDAPPSKESLFVHVEGPNTVFPEEPAVRQKPVLEAPMLALIPTLRQQATVLLDGSNRKVSLTDTRFRLMKHQENFTASAEVVESFISFIKPLETINFEKQTQSEASAVDFAQAVLKRLPDVKTLQATGPNLAEVDSRVHIAQQRAA